MRLGGYTDQWALVLADLVDRPSLSHLSRARPASLVQPRSAVSNVLVHPYQMPSGSESGSERYLLPWGGVSMRMRRRGTHVVLTC